MTEITYRQIDPYALQAAQNARVRPAGSTEGGLCGQVVLVDSANRYISVIVEGTTTPVALPAEEWLFEIPEAPRTVPQEDGMYVLPDDPTGSERLLRRKNGKWFDLMADPTVEIPEEEIPEVFPLRAISTAPPAAAPAAPPAAAPAPEIPVEPTAPEIQE